MIRKAFSRLLLPALFVVALMIYGRIPGPLDQAFALFSWETDDLAVVGLSGLEMADSGDEFIAVTDYGTILKVGVKRQATHITGLDIVQKAGIDDPSGIKLTRFQSDIEGITLQPDGSFVISLEGYTRILGYSAVGAKQKRLHDWDRFTAHFGNSAFEAIATLPDGRLVIFLEAKTTDTETQALIYDGENWLGPVAFPVSSGYRITGADLGMDGSLYIVERRFSILDGFLCRVKRYHFDADTMVEQTLIDCPSSQFGNVEGISVWAEPSGQTVLTMLSDSGWRWLANTQLIEFRPKEPEGVGIIHPNPFLGP
jgi:hypothetical protein